MDHGDNYIELGNPGHLISNRKYKITKMCSNDAMAWDFVSIDVKFCAESEFEMSQVSRRLVFALWGKNDTSDNHFETKRVVFGLFLGIKTVRFVRQLKLGKT